mgnify:CR=1 FL=1
MSIIKKQHWLIPILLSIFFSTSMALAGYTKVGDFYDKDWASYSGQGQGANAYWTHEGKPKYELHGQTTLTVDATAYDYDKDDTPNEGPGVLHSDVYYDYIILKGGSASGMSKGKGKGKKGNSEGYAELWEFTGNTGDGNTKGKLINQIADNKPDLSHATGYNPAPIPGAIWLLGAGLLGVVGLKRFSKSYS